jgi:acetyl esterase/lipase
MRYLFHSLDVSPPNVTLIGDSAGGHLLLSLLLHLHHSNPLVAPLKIQGRIGRAALISPWVVDMSMDCESMKVNRNRDVLDGESLQYWASNFMGGAAPDYWNSHLTVPEDWWSFLPVDDILVLYGENEVLRDGVTELCRVLQSRHAKVMVKGFPGELHTHMLMNRFLLINKPCESERVFCDWLEGRAVN